MAEARRMERTRGPARRPEERVGHCQSGARIACAPSCAPSCMLVSARGPRGRGGAGMGLRGMARHAPWRRSLVVGRLGRM
eukprot:3018654-Prymnesium_polylepis.1